MSFLVRPGRAPTIVYAGRPMEILAGLNGRPSGFAVAELTVPAGFPGPPPHAHDLFDEGIYVLEGSILVVGDGGPVEAGPGSLFVAPRGERHGFANPSGHPARVLGLWGPADPAMTFMEAIGAVLPTQGPPDIEAVRAVYEAHHSRVLP
jgi:mannose-6-phosphate isomerase-like protein (cupin superfamily)